MKTRVPRVKQRMRKNRYERRYLIVSIDVNVPSGTLLFVYLLSMKGYLLIVETIQLLSFDNYVEEE